MYPSLPFTVLAPVPFLATHPAGVRAQPPQRQRRRCLLFRSVVPHAHQAQNSRVGKAFWGLHTAGTLTEAHRKASISKALIRASRISLGRAYLT
ncbi:hypothetical protein E2C01_066784 [Portunus trituberculatus]|uniref:Uncharacterized protein n=1 Tax=Portunus trituberculatus TaxID=210409 RepID=A0A5B7HT99_PORTR|nr:hypothetical protein [Portunus trituberculatus]